MSNNIGKPVYKTNPYLLQQARYANLPIVDQGLPSEGLTPQGPQLTPGTSVSPDIWQLPEMPDFGTGPQQPQQPQGPTVRKSNLPWAAAAVTGLNMVAQGLEQRQTQDDRRDQINRGSSDNLFPVVTGSRGDYEMNTGFFRPDQHVAVQFRGAPQATHYGQAADGMEIAGLTDGYLPTEVVPEFIKAPMMTGPLPVEALTFEPGGPQAPQVPQAPVENVQAPQGLELDPETALQAIFGNEGGATGMRTKAKGSAGRATASGRYQMVNKTVQGVWNAHFKTRFPDYSTFKKLYDTNPEIEHQTAKAHMTDLIQQYGQMALGAWYYPAYADRAKKGDHSVMNKIPAPEYGNKISFGKYYNKALKAYGKISGQFAEGGDVFEEGPGDPKPLSKKEYMAKYGDKYTKHRADWHKYLDRKQGNGKTIRDNISEIAGQHGLDPAAFYTSAMEEGMEKRLVDPDLISEAYLNVEKDMKGYPVDGFFNYGLDTFGEKFPDYVKKGWLKEDFAQNFKTFDAVNERNETMKSAAFKDDYSALMAKAVMMREAQEAMQNKAKKTGVELSPDALTFMAMAGYNGGLGLGSKMMDSYKQRGYLNDEKFLQQDFQPGSYAGPYTNVQRRMVNARALKDMGYFEEGGEYELTADEIAQIRANGGEVEFL